VAPGGAVVAVDADARNLACLQRNVERWQRSHAPSIRVLHLAMWSHDDGVEFSQEGNMGASVAALVGRKRGALTRVPSATLSSLAARCELQRVDFVKCDIEGAERVVLDDPAFFERFRPRLVIETHVVDGTETTQACIDALSRHGYRCRRIAQHGVTLPLLECDPAAA
jgi:FkbM family methyltransferase